MKKMLSLLLLLLTLTGCGGQRLPSIEDHDWEMAVIASQKTGEVLFTGREELYPDTPPLSLTCQAEGGVLTLSLPQTGQDYTGRFRATESGADAVCYEVTFGETKALAVLTVTERLGEEPLPTLLLVFSEWAVTFYPEPPSGAGA